MSIVDDLVQHVANQRRRAITSALQLLDDDDDILAFLFAVVCADVGSLANSLKAHADAFPNFAKLTSAQQVIAVSSTVGGILSGRADLPVNAKALAMMMLAQKEIRPSVEIILR